ncbi:MAG TPA: proton-conducting transporter membrane subunit [Candidatus Kapabacteria bacterium]|nr:proton-conducting transporter membrane subunit [Candidatus Kapabacteria bacterium]
MTELDPALQLTLLLLALPLAAFLCHVLIGLRRYGTGGEEGGAGAAGAGAGWWIGTLFGFAMLAVAVVTAALVLSRPETPLAPSYYPKAQASVTLVNRAANGAGITPGNISIGIVAGNASSLLLILVALIGLCSHLAAREDAGFMRAERVFSRAGNALLTFAAAGVIVSADLLSTLAFLQLAAVAAWMMLRRCGEAGEERTAAGGAYIMARAGDVAMLAGAGMLFARFGTVQIAALFDAVYAENWSAGGGTLWLTVAGLLLACGALARAGQVPWHAWLVRASTAPASVAIPMHTTMAAIGIYLLARLLPILTVDAMAVLAIAGTATAVIGATSALAQQDVRRILSFVTVAVLGLLTAAIGMGRADVALLYFLPCAAAITSLFLGVDAAARVVARGREPGDAVPSSPFDIGMMRGLRRSMPLSSAAMTIAAACVVGLPLTGTYLSGRFLVPMALGIGYRSLGNWDWFAGLPILLAELLVGFALFRMLLTIFLGMPPSDVRDSAERRTRPGTSRWLLAPVTALALWPAYSRSPVTAFNQWQLGRMLAAGSHVAPTPERWLMRSRLEAYARTAAPALARQAVAEPRPRGVSCSFQPSDLASVSFGPHDMMQCGAGLLALAVAGFASVRRRRRGEPAGGAGRVQRFLLNGWYLDAAMLRYPGRLTTALAKGAAWFDANLLDGVSNAAAGFAARSARGLARFDVLVVDGMLNLAAGTTQFLGLVVRQAQSGRVQIYLLYAAIGIIALFFLFR